MEVQDPGEGSEPSHLKVKTKVEESNSGTVVHTSHQSQKVGKHEDHYAESSSPLNERGDETRSNFETEKLREMDNIKRPRSPSNDALEVDEKVVTKKARASGGPTDSAPQNQEPRLASALDNSNKEPQVPARPIPIAMVDFSDRQTSQPSAVIDSLSQKNVRPKDVLPEPSEVTDSWSKHGLPKDVLSGSSAFTSSLSQQVMPKNVLPESSEVTGSFAEQGMPKDVLSESGTPIAERPSSPGGIYDDADEDETFDLSVLKQPSQTPTSPTIRPDLVAAILGTEANEKVVPTPDSKHKQKRTLIDEAKPAKKKRQSKHALIGRKEAETAKTLLSSNVDLSVVLPAPDCSFLAKELWIFTLKQLEYVMNGTTQSSEDISDTNVQDRDVMTELKEALVSSSLLKEELKKDSAAVDYIETLARNQACDAVVETASEVDLNASPQNPTMNLPRGEGGFKGVQKVAEVLSQPKADTGEGSIRVDRSESLGNNKLSTSSEISHQDDVLPEKEVPCRESESVERAIIAKIHFWKESIARYKLGDKATGKEHFSLNGPISFLFPVGTLQFALSVKIETLFAFLSLKKTETGKIVEMYRLWRQKCGLRDMGPLPLAKHLLGVASRTEKAIGSVPHARRETREWMGSAMVVATAAAKDFIITESKIYSPHDFVQRRTKDLANKLVEWRIAKGHPELRGTGKVAMISAWKAMLKQAIELESEEGTIVRGVDFAKEVDSRFETQIDEFQGGTETETAAKTKKAKHEAILEQNLVSPTFLSSVFKDKILRILESVGITTAQDLLGFERNQDSPLVKAIMKHAFERNRTASTLSCANLIESWCQRLMLALGDISNGEAEIQSEKASRPFENRKPVNRIVLPRKPPSTDPYDALSKSSKAFLASIGIKTAEAFMTARSTDIATEFIKWREQQNKPVLRGLGAVASVSGWKAVVRKAARNVGKEDIALMNPGSKPTTIQRSPRITEQVTKPQSLKHPEIKEETDKHVLFGSPTKAFAVIGDFEDRVYYFQLSVRRSSLKPKENSLYLTYLGSAQFPDGDPKKRISFEQKFKTTRSHRSCLCHFEECAKKLPRGQSESFCTLAPGCGLIELSRYGVQPLPGLEGDEILKDAILEFIQNSDESNPKSTNTKGNCDPRQCKYNVFERFTERKKNHYYLYLREPIETGQTVELHFLLSQPPDDPKNDLKKRHWIREQISHLSLKRLRKLLDYLNDDIGASVHQKMSVVFDNEAQTAHANEPATNAATKLAISRRRMQWLALIINSQHQRLRHCSLGSIGVTLPHVALTSLWTNELVHSLQNHPDWKSMICEALFQEAENEISAEFSVSEFGEFANTREVWCPMAKRLFHSTVDLFKAFTSKLEPAESEEKLVYQICFLVSEAALTVKRLMNAASAGEPKIFTDIELTYKIGTAHDSKILPTFEEVQQSSSSIARDEFRVVATNGLGYHGSEHSVLLQSVDEMKEVVHCQLDLKWYVERQIIAVVEAAALCGVANVAQNTHLNDIGAKIRSAASSAIEDPDIHSIPVRSRVSRTDRYLTGRKLVELPRVLYNGSENTILYQPNSSQFFLGLVWPILKRNGWKLEAEETASSLSFLPPGRKKDVRARSLKKQAARRRAQLSKRSNDLGLGYIPKSAKRLLIKCSAVAENIGTKRKVSVSDALTSFLSSMREKVGKDLASLKQVQDIVDHIALFFNEVAPRLFYSEEKESLFSNKEFEGLTDALGCEYLMRSLLLMPSMLQQSDLSFQQIEDTVGVIRELMDFLVFNHSAMFDGSFHLPYEDYGEETRFPPFILSRIKRARSNSRMTSEIDEENLDDLEGVILPKDVPDLTDFVACVMSQVVICRATSEDLVRKGRRVQLGFPGLVCRHCLGKSGEGKYFFGSLESITTAATVIEKHIAKCPSVDNDIKEKMVRSRARHAEQRRTMPQGTQSAFFTRLWDRIRRSSKYMGADADSYITFPTTSDKLVGMAESNDEIISEKLEDQLEFQSHIQLMRFLQTSSPWKENQDLMDVILQYYNCLEYGGRIYNTNAMPPHFSSEWLLAKVAPLCHPKDTR